MWITYYTKNNEDNTFYLYFSCIFQVVANTDRQWQPAELHWPPLDDAGHRRIRCSCLTRWIPPPPAADKASGEHVNGKLRSQSHNIRKPHFSVLFKCINNNLLVGVTLLNITLFTAFKMTLYITVIMLNIKNLNCQVFWTLPNIAIKYNSQKIMLLILHAASHAAGAAAALAATHLELLTQVLQLLL